MMSVNDDWRRRHLARVRAVHGGSASHASALERALLVERSGGPDDYPEPPSDLSGSDEELDDYRDLPWSLPTEPSESDDELGQPAALPSPDDDKRSSPDRFKLLTTDTLIQIMEKLDYNDCATFIRADPSSEANDQIANYVLWRFVNAFGRNAFGPVRLTSPLRDQTRFDEELQEITTLTLEEDTVPFLPASIGKLSALRAFDACGSDEVFTTLPQSLSTITALKTLELCDGYIDDTINFRGAFTSVTTLRLTNNGLTELPESFCTFTNLKELDLSYNKLEELPEWFGKFVSLKRLNLSNNALRLTNNGLTELPESSCMFTNLKELDLSYNKLGELPEWFGEFVSLKRLDLSQNELEDLPESFSKLTVLERLNLDRNWFQILPKHMPFASLKKLILSRNVFSVVPKSIYPFPAIDVIMAIPYDAASDEYDSRYNDKAPVW